MGDKHSRGEETKNTASILCDHILFTHVTLPGIEIDLSDKTVFIKPQFKSELELLGPIKPGEFTLTSDIDEGKEKPKAKLNEL